MKFKIEIAVIMVLIVLPSFAYADAAMQIISNINDQLYLPHVKADVEMVVERGKRKPKKYSIVLHVGVYEDAKTKIIIQKNFLEIIAPNYKKATIYIERYGKERPMAYIKLPDNYTLYRSSYMSDRILKSGLVDKDLEVLEDTINYDFKLIEGGFLKAISKGVHRTFYGKKLISVEKMSDGSWVETGVKYFDSKGKYLKTSKLSNFVEITKGSWRPRRVIITEERKKRTTKIVFSGWSVLETSIADRGLHWIRD